MDRECFIRPIHLATTGLLIVLIISANQYLHHDVSIESDTEWVQMDHCPCKRKITTGSNIHIPFESTTCSRDAYERGHGQKVVAFSYYGDINSNLSKAKGYFEGIKGNLELLPILYPGYLMRIYFDLDPEHPVLKDLCALACENNILDICHVNKLPGTPVSDARKVFPMIWRFFPTLDPQVDVYLSRDLDSRINKREQAAVKEWLETDQPIHSMRDHPFHGVSFVGASWGSNLSKKNARELWMNSWTSILSDKASYKGREDKGPDQEVLNRHVWPWAQNLSVQHDSYTCQYFPGSRPFPTERKIEPNNYVASIYIDFQANTHECPVACRPKNHKDWTYC